ncbi:MAG: tetratricopeptide repeat protein, partial [Cyanobacteria bacterium J06636_16]
MIGWNYRSSEGADSGVKATQMPTQRRLISKRAESIEQMRQRVSRAVRHRDYPNAITTLNRLLSAYPCSAADYSNRGLVYLWSGDSHRALLDFNRAIALNPALASSYNNRANYYASQGARESAIEDYDRAIDLNPFHVQARINRAVTLRELRRYDAALDGFEEALIF